MLIRTIAVLALLSVALFVTACGGPDATPSPVPTATANINVSATQTVDSAAEFVPNSFYFGMTNDTEVMCVSPIMSDLAGHSVAPAGQRYAQLICQVSSLSESVYINPTQFTLVDTDSGATPIAPATFAEETAFPTETLQPMNIGTGTVDFLIFASATPDHVVWQGIKNTVIAKPGVGKFVPSSTATTP